VISKQRLKTQAFNVIYSSCVPFEIRCRLLYWERRRLWSTRRPVTFSQKLLRKMLMDRRPLLTTFADKIAARDYVARIVGPDLLTQLYAVVSDPSTLNLSRLPSQFVVKPNHASGMIWIVRDQTYVEEPRSHLSTTPDVSGMFMTTLQSLNLDLLQATCRKWLATNYADVELEWAYRHIKPRIMVEELLLSRDGQIPPDYKFYVFDGCVRLLEVHTDRFGDHRCNLIRPDWTAASAQLVYPPAVPEPLRPDSLGEMIHVAELLGQETDFVRVDLYDIGGRIVFGELTSFPGGPYAPGFTPHSFDVELGGYWNLPKRYR